LDKKTNARSKDISDIEQLNISRKKNKEWIKITAKVCLQYLLRSLIFIGV
jgi:hypothetical protein